MMASAMFVALCADGKLHRLREALQNGADVNAQDEYERTGLMMAMRHNQPEVATLLLRSEDVEVNAIDALGRSALHYAALRGNNKGLTMLLAHPNFNTVNLGDIDGLTALTGAVAHDAIKCIKLLLADERVDPNIKLIWQGDTALMWAVRTGKKKSAELLLSDPRVDLMTRDNYNRSEEEVTKFVAEYKEPVAAALEECVNIQQGPISVLRGQIWKQIAEPIIMGELERYWKGLAANGRTLEEAARFD